MLVFKTDILDLLVIEPKVFGDKRGWFYETYQAERYSEYGVSPTFVQDNLSFSKKGTLRGLHIQTPCQGKLVQVIDGEIYDVAVDLRKESPTFGEWYGLLLSSENKKQFWIPEGFAHGFYVLSDTAIFSYKCTNYYSSEKEQTLMWNDPELGISWPIPENGSPILSPKDLNGKPLSFWKS